MDELEKTKAELKQANNLLKFAFGILGKFDYTPSDEDCSTSLFEGYESEDWFYSVKNSIEKHLDKSKEIS